jgi:ABC-type nickel/cobalt efflux system permease component RcnA
MHHSHQEPHLDAWALKATCDCCMHQHSSADEEGGELRTLSERWLLSLQLQLRHDSPTLYRGFS